MGMTAAIAFCAPLFVPATKPERFEKAAASGADAVILDLEDAVAPADKVGARGALRTDFTALPVIIRVNAPGTVWHEDDLAAVARLDVAAVMVPKLEHVGQLDRLRSGPAGRHAVVALIESAVGMANVRLLASRLTHGRLAFGSVDYAADLDCAHERPALAHARSELVLASRLMDLAPPLDGVTLSIRDVDAVADDARHGRSLGFGGKLCIHPSQVGPVQSAYVPSEEEVDWACRVLASGDGGVAVADGAMVDEPVRRRARQILTRAGRRSIPT